MAHVQQGFTRRFRDDITVFIDAYQRLIAHESQYDLAELATTLVPDAVLDDRGQATDITTMQIIAAMDAFKAMKGDIRRNLKPMMMLRR